MCGMFYSCKGYWFFSHASDSCLIADLCEEMSSKVLFVILMMSLLSIDISHECDGGRFHEIEYKIIKPKLFGEVVRLHLISTLKDHFLF